jgi:hypothetical protein
MHSTLELDVDEEVLGVGFVLYDTESGRVYDDRCAAVYAACFACCMML